MTGRRSRRVVGAALAFGALAAGALVAACSRSVPSPISVSELGDASLDVVLTAETQVREDEVVFTYRLENRGHESVWLGGSERGLAVPDDTTRGGVAVVRAFFPVRTDHEWLYPPHSEVSELVAGEVEEGELTAERPFASFTDLDGDRAVTLPRSPSSVRLCVAYVPDSSFDPEWRPSDDDGTGAGKDGLWIEQQTGFLMQRLACSEAVPLGG